MCPTRYFQSILVPTVRFAQKDVVVCKINVSSISTQQIVYSANLEYHLYRACFPWQMQYDWKIEYLEVENAYTHTWMAYLLFHNCRFPQRHLGVQVAFRAEMPPVLEEVLRFLCTSSGSPDFLLHHCGMQGSRPNDFCKPLPGVFPSQPSPSDAKETQLLASSILWVRREVS